MREPVLVESTTKPVSPQAIAEAKLKAIPTVMIEAVNELLARKFVRAGSDIMIKQGEIRSLVNEKLGNDPAQRVETWWFNFEEIYRDAGWLVTYDKPGYNESYDAFFNFRPR